MTEEKAPGRRERVILYSVITALVAVLMVIGVANWRTEKATRAAEEKADRLIAALEELGTRVPSRDRIVKVLGGDGGSVCADPTNALRRAASLAQLSNGAGGPGTRPVIADSAVVKGELAIIAIYCPDKLSEFEEFVDGLRTTDLAPE
jgi:Tfp pilus assembly protein FimT